MKTISSHKGRLDEHENKLEHISKQVGQLMGNGPAPQDPPKKPAEPAPASPSADPAPAEPAPAEEPASRSFFPWF